MKKILIVLNDAILISVFKSWVFRLQKKETLFFAKNAKEAIEVMNAHSIDLLITELDLPEIDGLELVSGASVYHPTIKIAFFLSNTLFTTVSEKLKKLTTIYFFNKPNSLKDFIPFVNIIEEIEFQALPMVDISISDFLQLIECQKKTCLVSIENESNQQKGFIYFEHGILYDATFADFKAEFAVVEMLAWKYAKLNFKTLANKQFRRQIQHSLDTLIKEGENLKLKAEEAAIVLQEAEAAKAAIVLQEAEASQALFKKISSLDLADTLQPLQEMDDYLASTIFDMAGRIVIKHQASSFEHNMDEISRNAVEIIKTALETVGNVGLGKFNFIQVNADQGIFEAVLILENQFVGAVLLNAETSNTGLAKIRLIKVGESIRSKLV
ncbi:MAG: DUF4388 domain-containing protein [Methylococcales bacterium]